MSAGSAHTNTSRVSIITATWNRAHLLERCYHSLCRQVPLPCEWIVVDDGSTDNTRDVIARFAESAPFDVRFVAQANAGKHHAVNRATTLVRGELVLILDSDDMLTPQALSIIQEHWMAVPEDSRAHYAGLVGHSVDANGTLIGRPFPADSAQLPSLRLFHSARVQGDKLFVHRAEILKQFPFPTFPHETFLSEGIVWDRIRTSYRYRLLNEALQVVEYQRDGLSATSLSTRVNNPAGARAYYRQLASLDISWAQRLRSLVNYQRFASHGGVRSVQAFSESPLPLVSALLLPVGALMAKLDRMRLRARRHEGARQ